MQCLFRILTVIMLVSTALADRPAPVDLPALIERARQALATFDVSACRSCGDQLDEFLTANPKTPDLPDLLLLCAKCDICGDNLPRAGANAVRVVDQFPLSSAAPMAYEIALRAVAGNGANPSAAASLARNFAEGLSSDPRAARYWRECLEWHQKAGEWNDVLSVGLYCLNVHTSETANPALQFAVADAALKVKDSTRATALFEQLAARKDNVPEAVLAHRYLAAASDAPQHNRAAWALFDKNSRQPEFERHDIAAAAAQALWDLQELAFADYLEITQTPEFKESKCQRALNDLERGYNDVLAADVELAVPALNRIGEARALFADALQKDDAERNTELAAHPPYVRALPEYARAAAAYTRAFEEANEGTDQADAARVSAQHAFDLTVKQGDLVAAWGRELYGRMPTTQPGVDSRKPRLNYLTGSVAPVLTAAVERYGHAIELARNMPLDESSAALRARLDTPLRPLAATLTELVEDYAHALSASAAELGSMSAMSFDVVAIERQEAKVETETEQLLEAQKRLRPIMAAWNASLLAAALPASQHEFWIEQNVRQFDKISAAQQSVQDNVLKSMGRVERSADWDDLAFRRKLAKLQARAVSEEYRTLIDWHEYVSQGDVQHSVNDRLYARLAVVDPVHFGAVPNSGAATRPNP